jgi:hypothetical protein
MKTIISFLFLTFSLTASAQKSKPEIEFCPLCLVDEFSFPTIQGGIEFYLTEKLSLYNEIGIKYRKGYYETADTSFIGSNGFKLKTELRYYISYTEEHSKNTYVAINGFYYKDNHNTETGYYYQGDSLNPRYDNFGVKKLVIGTNVLIGCKKTIWNNFSFDAYAGVGLRFVSISTVSKEFDKNRDKLRQPMDVTIVGMRDRVDANEKADNIGNITLGIRLCYQL